MNNENNTNEKLNESVDTINDNKTQKIEFIKEIKTKFRSKKNFGVEYKKKRNKKNKQAKKNRRITRKNRK